MKNIRKKPHILEIPVHKFVMQRMFLTQVLREKIFSEEL